MEESCLILFSIKFLILLLTILNLLFKSIDSKLEKLNLFFLLFWLA